MNKGEFTIEDRRRSLAQSGRTEFPFLIHGAVQ